MNETSNVELPTSNVERKGRSRFDVRRSAFDVRSGSWPQRASRLWRSGLCRHLGRGLPGMTTKVSTKVATMRWRGGHFLGDRQQQVGTRGLARPPVACRGARPGRTPEPGVPTSGLRGAWLQCMRPGEWLPFLNRCADIPVGVMPAGKPALRGSWIPLRMEGRATSPRAPEQYAHRPLPSGAPGGLLASPARSRALPSTRARPRFRLEHRRLAVFKEDPAVVGWRTADFQWLGLV